MIRWGWRTRQDGIVVVWDLPDGPERVMVVSAEMAKQVDSVQARWGGLFDRVADEEGLPHGWLQAHCWRESGGNPKARNPEGTPDPGNDGVGLFQITAPALKGRRKAIGEDGQAHWVGGYTDAQLEEPERNTRIAARYIRDLIKVYGPDFPKVSAAFNAGSVHAPAGPKWDNPWNMHQTQGHVSSEVAAYNYWLQKYAPATEDSREAVTADLLARPEISEEAKTAFALVDLTPPERDFDAEARERDTDPEGAT